MSTIVEIYYHGKNVNCAKIFCESLSTLNIFPWPRKEFYLKQQEFEEYILSILMLTYASYTHVLHQHDQGQV